MPDIEHWSADDPAVWKEKLGDQTIAVRHPSYPAEATWDGNANTFEPIIARYLSKVADVLGLPGLLKAGKFAVPLAWLPLRLDDPEGNADPRASFVVTRYDEAGQDPIDRTVVFVAAESRTPNDAATVLGSRLGIRVVAHIANDADVAGTEHQNVRITSATRSAELAKVFEPRAHEAVQAFLAFFFTPDGFRELSRNIRRAAGLSLGAPFGIDGVRFRNISGDRAVYDIYASVPRARPEEDSDSLAYALTAEVVIDKAKPSPRVVAIEKDPLVAHVVQANLFTQDPASLAGPGGLVGARPNRSPQRLANFRQPVTLEGIVLDAQLKAHLQDNNNQLKVTKSKLVDPAAVESQEEVVAPAAVTHARMNALAALGGYQRGRAQFDQHHARPLFETLLAYGLSPVQYFKFATRPLIIRYRARIRPGPGKDGKTVNAQVDFDPPSLDLVGPDAVWDPTKRKPLEVRFALADLQRSVSRREPLGLAADPRWSWHEYFHALLAARTGALELQFAHSAGDALAAITADPWSALVENQHLRGYTFPWVYLHRRHDRSVYDGFGWCGRYHRPAQFDPVASNRRRKGYDSEQILSSSLFRLYRALGGDTVLANGTPDRAARQRAADYVVYLVLKMMRPLPPAALSVIDRPGDLVTALIAVDTGTWPVAAGPLKDCVGGWAGKVVRWAFEAQGLYATTDPLVMIDAPGKPPSVDVFIDDSRPNSDGDFPRGGYMPVSLDWHAAPGASPWHAHPNAMIIDAQNRLRVEVRNRGELDAAGVTVRVWWIAWPAGNDPPKWDAGTWNLVDTIGPQMVPAGAMVPFEPFALPPQPAGTRRLILAAATCPGDRANMDPATGYPCSIKPTPIVDLVAGDNNLGLRLREVL